MEIVPAYERQKEILELFKEYTDLISSQGEEVKACLASQHYEEEIRDLQAKYGPPAGRLYLALAEGEAAGCAALTGNGEDYCEIKRVYVREKFRGMQIGRRLAEKIIREAREAGYRYMRLDTFLFMKSAIRLYEKLGFYYIGRYNDNPAAGAVFMELDLKAADPQTDLPRHNTGKENVDCAFERKNG